MTTTLNQLTGDYVLDAARTRIGFVARHRMATRVRGRFDVFEGAVHLDGDDPARSSAQLTIRADSIETGDRRRDAQLRKDFLDAATHPIITFISTKVSQVGSSAFEVTGDLTIRGITHPVTVPFELVSTPVGDIAFAAALTIERARWQVNWNAFTTALVSPTVVLDLQVFVAA
ncbi:polyisoprenoid-binding protein YceI [Kribbella rubisoli]|uniref:Polyisoprenoid-binding protein YceI n=1 Tax=Kribbella rubisoli TaxID=3075929 RepID=A0A4Q7WV80_9ACTN|nr:YceI family protein [Kribbella rubisoli]RZU13958.1 polyisoprenoid-binding protein YceI [Kribbella rubisoli]